MFNDPPAVNAGSCSSGGQLQTGTINVYVQWVNTSGATWSAGDQALIRTFLNGISGSTAWPLLATYDSRFATTTLSVASECTQTNNMTSLSCSNVTASAFSGCTGQPGWNASDSNGLYLYLPADPAITCNVGCAGEHCALSGGTFNTIFAIPQTGTFPQPNASARVDSDTIILWHEVAEQLTDYLSGWRCSIGSGGTEIGDLCNSNFGFGGPWLGNVGGQPYNVAFSGDKFVIQGLWQGPGTGAGLASGCFTQVPDTSHYGVFNAPFTTSLGWRYANVEGGWSAIPTCTDGQKDGFETDVDCGGTCPSLAVTGPLAPANGGLCLSGKACQYFTDCQSGVCTAGVCN